MWTPPPPRSVVEMELAGAGVDAGMMSDAARHEPRAGCVFLLLPFGGVYTVEVNECDRVSDVVSRANERHGPLVPSAATLHHQGRRGHVVLPCRPIGRLPFDRAGQRAGQMPHLLPGAVPPACLHPLFAHPSSPPDSG
uniref:Uncharacterized protein LOC116940787 isoform X2 n=1 Tax=Petromyzon marinus TaxID=7757 RepID=A0AAJ7SYF7_PETMA|nr:uncharacterized protein LOC116940787 isoform X2 [Petromyzon marinus]